MSKRGKAIRSKNVSIINKMGGRGAAGISRTFPRGWDDGSGKVRHIESGPNKGLVYFTSRREAQDLAKRYSDFAGERMRYDPD